MLYNKKWDKEVKVVDEVGRALLRAADYLEEHGHCKFTPYDKYGRACVRGAFMKDQAWDLIKEMDARLASYISGTTMPVAYDATTYVVDWNNAPERTAEEVISALREAATLP